MPDRDLYLLGLFGCHFDSCCIAAGLLGSKEVVNICKEQKWNSQQLPKARGMCTFNWRRIRWAAGSLKPSLRCNVNQLSNTGLFLVLTYQPLLRFLPSAFCLVLSILNLTTSLWGIGKGFYLMLVMRSNIWDDFLEPHFLCSPFNMFCNLLGLWVFMLKAFFIAKKLP